MTLEFVAEAAQEAAYYKAMAAGLGKARLSTSLDYVRTIPCLDHTWYAK